MALGTKMVVLMFSITIVMFFAGSTMEQDVVSNDLAQSMGYQIIEVNNTTMLNVSRTNASMGIDIDGASTGGIQSGIVQIFTTYGVIEGTARVLFGIFFAPVDVLNRAEAPQFLVIAVGGIWVMMYVIALASFLWKKDF